jgi:hypothetical protein
MMGALGGIGGWLHTVFHAKRVLSDVGGGAGKAAWQATD